MSMNTLKNSFVFALGLAVLGLPALAQEAAPAEAPAAVPGEALSMGTEADAAEPRTKETAQVGEAYVAQNFDLWEQRCEKTEAGNDPCQLFQLLKDGEGNAVSEFSIFGLPDGGKAVAGATIVVPLETLLTANLTIAIDTAKPKIYPFTFCTAFGCVARIGFTGDDIAKFKAGAKATMTIVPAGAPEEKVALDLSLKGFTAGYDSVAVK